MSNNKANFVFGKKNYLIIAIGFALVIVGFLLMSGGKAEDPNTFNPDEIFSSRRITLAPFTVLMGFVLVGVGIMLKPRSDEGSLDN
tara:strand:+ start:1150 stop:1407 length:258 start_codon:yes stop_codon:yes gene_type:complete